MQSIESKIIASISKCGRGSVVFPLDFAGYGEPKAVQKAFERLTADKKIIRVARGIYCYPKIDKKLGLGILYPTFEEIAIAIAKRDKAKIVPTGVHALNKLGLSTQFPMNVVYFTDGSPRKIKLQEERGIEFKHTAKKNMAFQNDFTMLLTFALRELGEGNITDEQLTHVKALVSQYPFESIKNDFKLIPAWIRKIILSAYE
ncbi:hypothetical protein M2480_002334 [Parabacteroides sp. PFB2-12]|uniref:DUF6088 family protein n=1 Tax=unclassified Parabacteroides TaxID=2649774 RepID=UPI0024739708|nr:MULTISPECIES: DUF6088 family protein [unclassified Parabacteroides]MDH6343703.1 hypothetical protein [Parabacteroides sp. PM6-13]MDH6391339.1 hypothetical protein [Parabacteroides sp. PFB2-12]